VSTMMRYLVLAILPLAAQCFLPSSAPIGLSTTARLGVGFQPSPALCAAPALRGARTGVLAAKAVEYTVVKGDELKNGGHKYTFTVTVDGAMSKDSYSESPELSVFVLSSRWTVRTQFPSSATFGAHAARTLSLS
jgi:hypothetical protein